MGNSSQRDPQGNKLGLGAINHFDMHHTPDLLMEPIKVVDMNEPDLATVTALYDVGWELTDFATLLQFGFGDPMMSVLVGIKSASDGYATGTVEIVNPTGEELSIHSVRVVGSGATAFVPHIVGDLTSVGPDSTVTVEVVFMPSLPGLYVAQFVLRLGETGDIQRSVRLCGIGVEADADGDGLEDAYEGGGSTERELGFFAWGG